MTDNQPIPPAPQSEDKADNDAAHPNSNAVPEVKIPPPHPSYAVTYEKKRDKWDIAKLIAEFVGLGFLIVYTLYTAGIYCANQKAAEAAHDTLGQIQQQTALMQQQLESSTACILFRQYRLTWPDHRGYLSTIMDNRGKAACSNIDADLRLTEMELTHAIGRTLAPWSFSVPDLSPSLTLPIERGRYLNEIGPNELDGNNRLPKAIRITGTFNYWNGFEKKSEDVCIYVIGVFHANSQSAGITTVTCDSLPPQIAWYMNLLPKNKR